ncbi:MAG: SIS domain-containing protein [Bacteroidales bacterium]|nr:SIS domain-containing protein [Bacteroidales bacterium]
MSLNSDKKAEEFLAISGQYKLGGLVTEAPHPATADLSSLASNDLHKAVSILKDLDVTTLKVLSGKKAEICYLKNAILDTLNTGNNIYFCGCGATGRLSLTIETLWRQVHEFDDLNGRVFSFMAGGDVALIRSIENFEDFPHYGARQLAEAGFKDGDLLIATTEGGETPFVIGAAEKAAGISYRKPFFLYCNPDDLLCIAAERSRLVIENQAIEKINLTVGPMAVTGSTRMQSSTILLAAAGIALLCYNESDEYISDSIDEFSEFWESADIHFIENFIIKETECYRRGEYLLYEADNRLGITIITDTTERSPTFSLYPFENENEPGQPPSLCYIYMPSSDNSKEAWNSLLWRAPRTLEWPETDGIASMHRLLGFDFSTELIRRRERSLKEAVHHLFKISLDKSEIHFVLDDEKFIFSAPFRNPLFIHLLLKMILNTHSTLVMGRLGRYEGNVMTYVRASNNKLIDRAIRYIDLILKNKNINLSYEDLAHILFGMIERTPVDQAIVLATVAEIEKQNS